MSRSSWLDKRIRATLLLLAVVGLICATFAFSYGTGNAPSKPARTKQAPRFAPGVVVVTYRGGNASSVRPLEERRFDLIGDSSCKSPYFVRYFIGSAALAAGATVESTCQALAREAGVKFAEPDFEITPDQSLPNDALFPTQWGLRNTGQLGGAVGADVNAVLGWQLMPAGSDALVAVLDDGVNYNHPDLAANIAINSGEIAGNGIDDDGNGFVDDVRGWDTADDDNDPMPLSGFDHGTHVAGIVGAVTGNSIGVAGSGKRVKILPVRMYKGQATWMTSLANGIDYARIRAVSAINVSYSIDSFTSFLVEAVQRADFAGIPYINSAGNNGQSIDGLRGLLKQYASNVMFVAASDRSDNLASFSNYGRTVEIAAPGVSVASTVGASSYANWDGTSMATPFVAAAAAMVRAANPNLTAFQVLSKLKYSADVRAGLIPLVAGGRLDVGNALENDVQNPGIPKLLKAVGRTSATIKLNFGASGDDGGSGRAAYYEVHGSFTPITSQLQFEQAPYKQVVPGEAAVGTTLIAQLHGLSPGRPYYLAARARDNQGNRSGLATIGPVFTMPATFAEGFESSGWTSQFGKSWAQTNGLSYTGDRAWDDSPGTNYQNNESSALTQDTTVALSGQALVSFMAMIDLEAGYDYLFLECSLDDGATWSKVGGWTGTSPGWTKYTAALPGSGARSVKLRFRLLSDDSVTRNGVLVDDLYVVERTVLYSESVESDTAAWQKEGSWAAASNASHSPSNSWDDSPSGKYAPNVDATLQLSSAVGVQGYGDLQLAFWAKSDLEQDFDYLTVLLSLDGAAPAKAKRISGRNGAWELHAVSFDANLSVRPLFRLTSDDTDQYDGIYLDDFAVTGEPFVPGMAAVALTSISLPAESAAPGRAFMGSVELSGPAPEGGVTVTLKSSNSVVANVPDVVFLPEGTKSANFSVLPGAFSSTKSATLTAAFDTVSRSAVAQVRPISITSCTFNPASLVGGSNQKSQFTIVLGDPAPDAGLTLSMLSSDSAALAVPATVKFTGGQSSRVVSLGPAQNVTGEISVQVTTMWQTVTSSASLSVVPLKPTRASISPSSFVGGRSSNVMGTVQINAPAPAGGLWLTLASSNAALVVPNLVQVPAGEVSCTFAIEHSMVESEVTASFAAELNGFSVTSSSCQISPLLPKSISVSPSSVRGGSDTGVLATVTLNAPAGPGGFEVALSSNLPLSAVPSSSSITVPEGKSSVTFSVLHFAVASSREVRVRAAAGGKLVSAPLIVNP